MAVQSRNRRLEIRADSRRSSTANVGICVASLGNRTSATGGKKIIAEVNAVHC